MTDTTKIYNVSFKYRDSEDGAYLSDLVIESLKGPNVMTVEDKITMFKNLMIACDQFIQHFGEPSFIRGNNND